MDLTVFSTDNCHRGDGDYDDNDDNGGDDVDDDDGGDDVDDDDDD